MLELVESALAGNRRAIARLITLIEKDDDEAGLAMAQLFPHTGQAYIIGVTGSPGVGKSHLVKKLAKVYRDDNHQIGVLAIDPTSPFSGGAILGDRVRMRDLADDPSVFVRSMATRGQLGGLARAAADTIKIFDATGFDIVIVETVGTGQGEVEIAQSAHTVVVVEAPGMGDEIQSLKAGILEIADVFVVNKADREGAERTVAALESMLDLGFGSRMEHTVHHGRIMQLADPSGLSPDTPYSSDATPGTSPPWRPPVIKTIAIEGDGISDLVKAIDDHRHYLESSQEINHRNRIRLTNDLEHVLRDRLLEHLLDHLDSNTVSELLDQIVAREIDPHTAAQKLIEHSL